MLEMVPEGTDQLSECIEGRQGFLIKCSLSHGDYYLLFILYEIMKNMARISLLLETQSQQNNYVINWLFSCAFTLSF